MEKIKNIALVAHDNRKNDLIEWVGWNNEILLKHNLICTGTTGAMVETMLKEKYHISHGRSEFRPLTKLKSGPLGGDQQLGALIADGQIDILIFFWDPMEPQPHDVDVKALLRIAVLYNIPTASNRSSADFMISSSLITTDYQIKLRDYSSYAQRKIGGS